MECFKECITNLFQHDFSSSVEKLLDDSQHRLDRIYASKCGGIKDIIVRHIQENVKHVT